MHRSARVARLVVIAMIAVLAGAPVGHAAEGARVCEKFGSTTVAGGRYLVQNNEWGANDGQCVTATAGGFTVDAGVHRRDDQPAAYPSIVSGCWMRTCTRGTPLPTRVDGLGPLTSSISARIPPGVRTNLAYDLWMDPTPRRDGHNTGAELMIWLDERGGIRPIGAPRATVPLAGGTWEVWTGENQGVPVISYVRRGYLTRADRLPLTDFVRDAVSRRVVRGDWFLTNVQAGFEIWAGGPGTALDSFSVEP